MLDPIATISSNDSPVHLVSSTIDASILESGQFQLENSTLMGAVQIQDQVQIQGVTTLSNATITTSEAITFPNSRVTGFTKIIGNGSAVTYAGTLAAGSSLTIVNNGGTETITLPAAVAFHLDASGVNSFSSNDPALQALDPKALASRMARTWMLARIRRLLWPCRARETRSYSTEGEHKGVGQR